MARPIPTMDTKGLIYDPNMKLQWLLSYFITTEASQTNIYKQRNLSLPDINREFHDDPSAYKAVMEDAFKRMLEAYFDEAEVYVKEEPMEEPGKMKLIIRASARQDGQSYGLSEALIVTKDKVQRVAELYNV